MTAQGQHVDCLVEDLTRPLTVRHLNVAQSVEDSDLHPGLAELGEAHSWLDTAFDDHVEGDTTMGGYAAASDTLTDRYVASHAVCAERLAAAVAAIAIELGPPLPPEVVVDTHPMSRRCEDIAIRNPIDETNPLAYQIWELAHIITPLPHVDIQLEPKARKASQ